MTNSSLNLELFIVYWLLKFIQEIEYQNSWNVLNLIYYFHENFQTKMLGLMFNNTQNTFYKTVNFVTTSPKDLLHKFRFFSSYKYDFWNWHRQYIIFPGGFIRLFNQLLEDPNLSFEDKMRFEICRLASFSRVSNSFCGCPIKLAKGGFYYIPGSNSCKCAFCGIEKNDWEYSDNTDTVHRRLNQNCPFFHEGQEGSSETNYSIENGDSGQQPTLNLQAYIESSAVIHGGYVSRYQSEMSLKDQALHPQYVLLTNRKTSFGRWPNPALSPDRLAEAGFFYTGSGDWVACAFCGKKLRNWQAGCDPLIEHAHWSPECSFMKGNDKSLVQLVQSISLRSSLLSVEESTDTSSRLNDNQQTVTTTTNPTPRYPQYLQTIDRLSTFCGWPTQSRISPIEMVKSGLFYTGAKDYVKCFFCGIGLLQWEEGDNPLVEHARYSPECPHLRQIALNEERTISDYISSRQHQVETFEEQSSRSEEFTNMNAVEILSLILEQENEESIQQPNEQPSSSISESSNLTSNNADQSQSTNGSQTDAS